MGSKNKILPEIKIKAVQKYLEGKCSKQTIASKYEIDESSFRAWVIKYKSEGKTSFLKEKNNQYTTEFKNNVVKTYLSGQGSLSELAIKFKIPSKGTIRKWVLRYNSHEKFKDYNIGGTPIMTKGCKTTYEERVEIVKYCIEHNYNYAKTAQLYKVSYQQVYAWTVNYEKYGVEALLDRRGKRKQEDEMSELEKLRVKNKLLEAENLRQKMEIDFLKKLEEIERRRY